MDRREFVKSFFALVVRPAVLLIVLIFTVVFLYKGISENSGERIIIYVIAGAAIAFLSAEFVGLLFSKLLLKLYSDYSEKTKYRLAVTGEVFNYLIVLIIGGMLYVLWTKDWFLAAFFAALFIGRRINRILQRKKTVAQNT